MELYGLLRHKQAEKTERTSILDGVPKDIVQAYKYLDIARYNTQFSKNMNLKWSIRARLDELDSIITISQKKEAIKLAEEWTKSLHKK